MDRRSSRRQGTAGPIRHRGASSVLIAVVLVTLIGIAALGVDVANLVVAHQELRNAADAGALAGARCLYIDGKDDPDCLDSGTLGTVNPNANDVARQAAIANAARKAPAEAAWTGGTNGPDIERGHWSFGRGTLARGFYPNDALAPTNLTTATGLELDADPDLINAVRVTTRRRATRVQALFAGVLGPAFRQGTEMQAHAVAWVGFAGTLEPHEVDQPIAICKQKLLDGDTIACNVGRFIPSTGETGGWTTFEQPAGGQCNQPTGDAQIRSLVCSTGNPRALTLGVPVMTDNGQKNNAFSSLADCWKGQPNGKTGGWTMTLPVVDCDSQGNSHIQPCSELVGAVEVTVLWIQEGQPDRKVSCSDKSKPDKAAPCSLSVASDNPDAPGPWDGSGLADGNARWDSFATHYNLRTEAGALATVANGGWTQKTIYFKPQCTAHQPAGDSGGENFGILAKIPRLVE